MTGLKSNRLEYEPALRYSDTRASVMVRQRVNELRAKGKSYKEVAKGSDVTPETLRNIATGKRALVDHRVAAFAKLLGIPEGELRAAASEQDKAKHPKGKGRIGKR